MVTFGHAVDSRALTLAHENAQVNPHSGTLFMILLCRDQT